MKTFTSVQFRSLATPSGKKAFEAYVAIWPNDGKNIAIATPTLKSLKDAYKQVTGHELIAEAAQHVWLVKAERDNDAPTSPNPRGAILNCDVFACKNQASFIKDKRALCSAHRDAGENQ